MIQFKDLPVEIQECMLDEQVRQGNPRNAKVFEEYTMAGIRGGGFSWSCTVEGYAFWEKIIVDGDFAVFYEKYPKTSNEKLYSEEEVRNLFIKHCKDLYNIQGEFYKLLLEQDLKWFEENKK
jgi:hypothetical protein